MELLKKLTILAILNVLIVSCQQEGKAEKSFNLTWNVSPQPVSKGPIEIKLNVSDEQGRSVDNLSIDVEANMTHPGMVPVLGQATALGEGTYLVKLELTMGGDWIIFLTMTDLEGKTHKKEFQIKGVRGAH